MTHVVPWIGIAFTLVVNVASLAYMSGNVLTRISHIEEQQKSATPKLDDIGILKNQLSTIANTLERLEKALDRRSGRDRQ